MYTDVTAECKALIESGDYKASWKFEVTQKSGASINLPDERITDFRYQADAVIGDFCALGTASSNGIEISIQDDDAELSEVRFKKAIIKPFIGIEWGGVIIKYIPLGVFEVREITREDKEFRLKAYDYMMRFDKKSKLTYSFPMEVYKLVNDICNVVNVDYVVATITDKANARMSINKADKLLKKKTYREIISMCAEICGCFATINRFGQLEFRKVANAEPVAEVDSLFLSEIKIEDDINITGVDVTMNGATVISASGTGVAEPYNLSLMVNNPLLNKKTVAELQVIVNNISDSVGELSYTTLTLETAVGNPLLDVGDLIICEDDDEEHTVLITSLIFDYELAMEIVSTGGNAEKKNQEVSKVSDMLVDLETLPDMSGYAGAKLMTDGENAFWSLTDSRMANLPSPYLIDVTQETKIFYVNVTSGTVKIQLSNTNALPNNGVVDIIIIFPLSSSEVTITWDSFVKLADKEFNHTEANAYNEFVLRVYRSAFSGTWFLTRTVFL